jgi:hypothetical protein
MILAAARSQVSGMQTLWKRNTFCGNLNCFEFVRNPLSGTPAPHLRALRPQNCATGMRQQNVLLQSHEFLGCHGRFTKKKKGKSFLFFSPFSTNKIY